jgi:CHAT domain-containing protein/tetratricopeptide (TPR) repeat protein
MNRRVWASSCGGAAQGGAGSSRRWAVGLAALLAAGGGPARADDPEAPRAAARAASEAAARHARDGRQAEAARQVEAARAACGADEGCAAWARVGEGWARLLAEPAAAARTCLQAADALEAGGDHAGVARALACAVRAASKAEDRDLEAALLARLRATLPPLRAAGDRAGEATTTYGLGLAQLDQGEPARALGALQEALALQRAVGDRAGEGETLNAMGEACYGAGDAARALALLEQALPIRREVGDRGGEAETLADLGVIQGTLGRRAQALELLDDALELYRAVGDRRGEASALVNVGTFHARLGDAPGALRAYRAALALVRALGDRPREADALGRIAGVHADRREHAQAIEAYAQALALHRATGDRRGEAATLVNLATVQRASGERAPALAALEQALPLARALGDRSIEAAVLISMGLARAELGDNGAALELLEQALAPLRAVGNRQQEARVLDAIGRVQLDLGDTARALESCERGLELSRAAGDPEGEANALNSLGLVHAGLGDQAKALEHYRQALALIRTVGDRSSEATALVNIGNALADLGERARALEQYQAALALSRALGDRGGEGTALAAIGSVQSALGEREEALASYERALALHRAAGNLRGEAAALNNLGLVHKTSGEADRALERYEQALALFQRMGDRAGEGGALNNIGGVHLLRGDRAKAIAYCQQALVLLRAVGDRAGEAKTLDNLGYCLAGSAPARAILHYKQAVNLYQSLRKDLRGLDRETRRTYAAMVGRTYRRLADLLAAEGRLGEAEQVLELLKDEEFFEFARRDGRIVAGQVTLRGPELDAARRYDARCEALGRLGEEDGRLGRAQAPTAAQRARRAVVQEQLRRASAEFVAFLDGLGAALARDRRALQPAADAQGSAIQEALARLGRTEPGVVAVFTLSGEETVRTILVTPRGRTSRAPAAPISRTELGKLVRDLREALRDPAADPRPLAGRLYAALVAPLEAELAAAKATTILWFLDGALRYVPVAALHDGKGWLAQRYASVVVSSADLAALAAAPRATWDVLGLGVTEGHEGFSPLPGVRGELAAIVREAGSGAGLLPGTRRLDAQFTERALLEAGRERRAVVHVASHFAFQPGDETRSFLLLGDGGHLTLERLRAAAGVFRGVDLLALSACQTAVDGGEGAEVDGLARIARDQGAAAVLATLWPVSDASTPALMRRFYELREQEQLTKAEALRRAQVEMAAGALTPAGPRGAPARGGRALEEPSVEGGGARSGWTHPYYWAPFILMGNGR